MNALLPFALERLSRYGGFFPFGGALLQNGSVATVATFDGNERPDSQKVIDDLNERFRVERDRYRAVAVVYEVWNRDAGSSTRASAVAVDLEHSTGYTVTVVFRHRKTDGRVELRPPTAHARSLKVFTGE